MKKTHFACCRESVGGAGNPLNPSYMPILVKRLATAAEAVFEASAKQDAINGNIVTATTGEESQYRYGHV